MECPAAGNQVPNMAKLDIVTLLRLQRHVGIDSRPVAQQLAAIGKRTRYARRKPLLPGSKERDNAVRPRIQNNFW